MRTKTHYGAAVVALACVLCTMTLKAQAQFDGLPSPQELSAMRPPRWDRVPLLMRDLVIHTCNHPDAGTTAAPIVRFHTDSGVKQLRLNRIGPDFQPNQTRTFQLPAMVKGKRVQLRDLKGIELVNPSDDDWCVDRFEFRLAESGTFLTYTAADGDFQANWDMPAMGYTRAQVASGTIWLDGAEVSGPRSRLFSDVLPTYRTDSGDWNRPTIILHTCDEAGAGSSSEIEIATVIDGIERKIMGRAADRNQWAFFEVEDMLPFNIVNSVKAKNRGTDEWCIDMVGILYRHNGSYFRAGTVLQGSERVELGEKRLKIATRTEVIDRTPGNEWIPLGLPLTRHQIDMGNAVYEAFHTYPIPACQLPTQITRSYLENAIETMAGEAIASSDFIKESASYVTLAALPAPVNAYAAIIHLGLEVPGVLSTVDGEIRFALRPFADEEEMGFLVEGVEIDVQLPSWNVFDVLSFGTQGDDWEEVFEIMIANEFDIESIEFPSNGISPAMWVDDDGNLRIDWDAAIDQLASEAAGGLSLPAEHVAALKNNFACRFPLHNAEAAIRSFIRGLR
jgi:hypothetical protein